MPTLKHKINFFETEAGEEVEAKLLQMTEDKGYNTASSYSPNKILYPNNSMSFMQKHKNYLVAHPEINPLEYLSNLRLKTKLR